MMRNFTKIILGLIVLATSITANAMEWRVVSNEDFGGNETTDPMIRTDAPHDKNADADNGFYTPLNFVGTINPGQGKYMVIKSTGLAVSDRGFKLTDCGDAGDPCWVNFGDHTNPDDPTKGYFMVFDAIDRGSAVDINGNLVLYKKSLPVSCSGVQFQFRVFMASASQWGGNTIRLSIQDKDGKNLVNPINDDLSIKSVNPGNWKEIQIKFSIDDPSIDQIYFVVMATQVFASGYDFAMDDIIIEVNQPELNISASDFQYKKPVTLSAVYDQNEFDTFFGASSTNVVYQWYYKKPGEADDKYTPIGSKKAYRSGDEISHTISAFEKEEHNGTYKLVVSTDDNINNNLCSIQKTFVINENKNKLNVDICQDSTKVIEGHTVTWETGYDDASLEIIVKNVPYTLLPDTFISQCQNSLFPTLGDFPLDTIIKRVDECPSTVQKRFTRVKNENVKDEPKHLCKGDNYITNNNVPFTYTTIDELVGTPIIFDQDGCPHEQLVFVHPTEDIDSTVVVCLGETFNDVKYSTTGVFDAAVYTTKTQWGCKKTVTPKINVIEPVVVELDEVHCPSDNYTYNDKIYDYAIKTTITDVCKGCASNGCDSTTIINLVVNEGGVTKKDTLICREQILFGKYYNVEGYFQDTIYGKTESGCQKDTIWNIEVVQISLSLRMPFNQYEICDGQPAQPEANLKAYDSKTGKVYKPTHYWEPEVPQNSLTPKVYLNESTTYTIYADLDLPSDIDRNAKGCHAKESVTIKVNPMPELTLDSVNSEKRTVEYTVTGGTLPYHLYVNSAKSSTQKDLGITEDNEGILEKQPFGDHTLQVQDSTGCMSEKSFSIEAIQPEAMQFFSPNGDGDNDRWIIKNIDTYQNATVRIFDRFGKMILETNAQDFEYGWDGTYNGKHMPATDYWYEIDIEEIDRQYVGHFTLIH